MESSLLIAVVTTVVCTVLLLRSPVRVEVGNDGILLQRFGDRKYVPYTALASASIDNHAIVLRLLSGTRIVLSMGPTRDGEQSRDALLQRIEDARAAFDDADERNDRAITETFVAPGGRPIASWIREVRALTAARDYREVKLDAGRLWHLVTDGSARAAARAGAAVALAGCADPDTHERLRIASDACADPRLRVALQRVADGATDVEVEEALESLVSAERD